MQREVRVDLGGVGGVNMNMIKMHCMKSHRINKIEEKGIFQESYYVMP